MTSPTCTFVTSLGNFNPHEREARDVSGLFSVDAARILIHTSVKLVTPPHPAPVCCCRNFNPHEREARDLWRRLASAMERYFNPHEREARDPMHKVNVFPTKYFNPHEREARD